MILRGKLPLVGRLKLFSKGLPLVWQTSSSLGTYNAGTPVSRSIAINQPATYSLVSGTLPAGLTLSPAGLLTGTLQNVGGVRTFTIRASVGPKSVERVFTFTTVAGTLTWSSPPSGSLGTFERNSTFTRTFTATSSLGRPVTYTVTNGLLPLGLTLSGNTISGTITDNVATYSFNIVASDGLLTTTRSFSIQVTPQILRAAPSNLTSVSHSGSVLSPKPQTQVETDGFTIILDNAFYVLSPDSETSNFQLNFSASVSLKHIMPSGRFSDPAGRLYVEYINGGSWTRAYTFSQGVWTTNSNATATMWRVRAIGFSRFQIGTLKVTV